MSKAKAGKMVWIMVRGRRIPIRIKNTKTTETYGGLKGLKERKLEAFGKNDEYLGKLSFGVPKKGKSVEVFSVNVPPEHRLQGISKALFQRMNEFSGRIGKDFVRSLNIESKAQLKIRKQYKSKFVQEFKDWGSDRNSAVISLQKALKELGPGKQSTITSSTRIPKLFRKKKK